MHIYETESSSPRSFSKQRLFDDYCRLWVGCKSAIGPYFLRSKAENGFSVNDNKSRAFLAVDHVLLLFSSIRIGANLQNKNKKKLALRMTEF